MPAGKLALEWSRHPQEMPVGTYGKRAKEWSRLPKGMPVGKLALRIRIKKNFYTALTCLRGRKLRNGLDMQKEACWETGFRNLLKHKMKGNISYP